VNGSSFRDNRPLVARKLAATLQTPDCFFKPPRFACENKQWITGQFSLDRAAKRRPDQDSRGIGSRFVASLILSIGHLSLGSRSAQVTGAKRVNGVVL